MRNFITGGFLLLLVLTLIVTVIVGVAWLFDYKPNNLYFVWSILYKSLTVSFLFHLLFGAEIKFK